MLLVSHHLHVPLPLHLPFLPVFVLQAVFLAAYLVQAPVEVLQAMQVGQVGQVCSKGTDSGGGCCGESVQWRRLWTALGSLGHS